MSPSCWIGVDVGGTFTDAVAYDTDSGALTWSKRPSVPDAPARGVLDAVTHLVPELTRAERFVHGITIGTNAVIERKGAEVWVITTRGFRDTLEIARTERRELYNIKTLKPPALVPRTRILEADERMRHDGSVYRRLESADVDALVGKVNQARAPSIAVCFLHSFSNDAHEREMSEALTRARPGAFVCASSQVVPEMREYERFSTTVLNAYLGPLINDYLQGLTRTLTERGFAHTVFLMTSSGGVMSAERARRLPVHTVLSGPAGGVAAAIDLGRQIGAPNLITYDMGGTSTDVCLIEGLRAPLTNDQLIAGFPNRSPQMEIVTIGAGGGSIAWVDDGDILHVGPRSAGAVPGPAAYGRGGTEPTVTDANLRLGRLSPQTRLAETLPLDLALAQTALARLNAKLPGLTEDDLADGIIRIAVARMVSAIKEISIARGFDPRDFSLLAYGGAGPMHATLIAEELDVTHVVIPPSPGNFSAFGCLVSDLQQTHLRSRLLETRRCEWTEVEKTFRELEAHGGAEMLVEGVDQRNLTFRRELGMRYVGQSWELPVAIESRIDSMTDLEASFRAAHEKRYGHATDEPAEIVAVRVTVVGRLAKPRWRAAPSDERPIEPQYRDVYFGRGYRPTLVFTRAGLRSSDPVIGPALVEEMGAVTVVPPGWSLRVGELSEFHLTRAK